ncbi:MAG: hypothetical protein IJ789_00460 [Bacteroidales bacterium]|nr:hypothetical protein [Bacteroidales bacterium]
MKRIFTIIALLIAANAAFAQIGLKVECYEGLKSTSQFCMDAGLGAYFGNHWKTGLYYALETNNLMTIHEPEGTPFSACRIIDGKIGVKLSAIYKFDTSMVSVAVGIDLLCKFGHTRVEAYDSRCDRTEWSAEDGETPTSWFSLTHDGSQRWGRGVHPAIELSLYVPLGARHNPNFMFRAYVGFNLLSPIPDELRTSKSVIGSSDWDEFETYYGRPEINIFTETAAGVNFAERKIVYCGFSIGL